jgi:hypothetical protein
MSLLKRAPSAARRLFYAVIELARKRESLVIFRMLPGQLASVQPQLQDVTFMSRNVAELAAEIEALDFPRNLRDELRAPQPDLRLHLIHDANKVASWGFSVRPSGTWPLTETHSVLHVEEGAVCLFAFETLPEFRGRRLYPALLSSILLERFQEGAPAAYIWCAIDNRASYSSIKRVGFVEVGTHRYRRVLGFSTRTSIGR